MLDMVVHQSNVKNANYAVKNYFIKAKKIKINSVIYKKFPESQLLKECQLGDLTQQMLFVSLHVTIKFSDGSIIQTPNFITNKFN